MSFDLSSGCPAAEPHFGLRLTVSAFEHPTRLVGHLRDETFALGLTCQHILSLLPLQTLFAAETC